MILSTERRPWGSFTILYEDKHNKVKTLAVKPDSRLSLQYHNSRDEHWYVLSGEGEVELGPASILVEAKDVVDIPCGEIHRATNIGYTDLVVLEIAHSDIEGGVDENDIVRVEDDYGRA